MDFGSSPETILEEIFVIVTCVAQCPYIVVTFPMKRNLNNLNKTMLFVVGVLSSTSFARALCGRISRSSSC